MQSGSHNIAAKAVYVTHPARTISTIKVKLLYDLIRKHLDSYVAFAGPRPFSSAWC